MEQEYDFSAGERGKFYKKNVRLNMPIYMEPENQNFIETLASKKGLDVSTLVNKMIKKNIQIVKEMT